MQPSQYRRNCGRECSIPDCKKPAYCRTWCRLHYGRFRVNGDPVKLKGRTKHGDAVGGNCTSEYRIWASINGRCHNPNNHAYAHYGGRGITVCGRWRNSYKAFLADMGRRPSPKHSIDRKNTNGNYEPSNCRWATMTQQARNKRTNNNLTYNGETHCVVEWAEIVGISRYTIFSRLKRGCTPEEAIYGTRPHRLYKLTDEQVREIRKEISSGTKHRIIAARYGVRAGHISRIKTGVRRLGKVA